GAMINLSLSYLDRPARREIHVLTSDATLGVDMIAGTLMEDGKIEHYPVAPDATYGAMHQALLSGDTEFVCTLDEGLNVLVLIEAIERAAVEQNWQTVESQ
ncbi:MAG: gfo/Idh/MocA family oxidoreductase, partial [Granulosicoccus sp.]|nr:gfo/Idh/MocA family oxidoreductase [Granulosicoccus sp.]